MFDACLSGGGAILFDDHNATTPVSYTATRWTKRDFQNIGAVVGDPAWQAHWEAYMLLLALVTWRRELGSIGGRLLVRGDPQGVLQAVAQRRARNPEINLLVVEMQVVLGDLFQDLSATHFWSEDNKVCDDLSRMWEPAGPPLPSELEGVTPATTVRKKWHFLPIARHVEGR